MKILNKKADPQIILLWIIFFLRCKTKEIHHSYSNLLSLRSRYVKKKKKKKGTNK